MWQSGLHENPSHPSQLHDVFGEEQPPAYLAAILLVGIGAAAVFALSAGPMLQELAWWRAALALVLVLDIAAGCVANFTPSTNDFYAARPRNRWIFIAIHVHIIAVALIIGSGLAPAIAVWAYTIAAATIVNLLAGRAQQTFVGGLLLAVGLTGLPLLPGLTPAMVAVAGLFMLKVLFSFAVDHYRTVSPQDGHPR
ncbi:MULTISPECIES: hypothetical protein [unclassified Ensifer]|uniref:hypothetical protein n=1 Tax=unclassified Ensifer TaxID=2633371 RepID=UPI0008136A3C|nr:MULTISPECIES: hypothetical protein [unclassified Ensifer]OCP01781.1 hypothetical protein BC362_21440 [Ensifer sp. LC14]OCP09570.1 hypothetical protein BC374_03180 [Ensifer sp. LC13]OCP10743.1 hypothetical protein BBX50_03525 [Ensifer sp. LC11]OCP32817.1 hypothetical protein BC364_03180 [Ensifer sp. LC499]